MGFKEAYGGVVSTPSSSSDSREKQPKQEKSQEIVVKKKVLSSILFNQVSFEHNSRICQKKSGLIMRKSLNMRNGRSFR